MIRFPALLGSVALAVTCLAAAPAAQAAAGPAVTVGPAAGGHVGQEFAGFSYEKTIYGLPVYFIRGIGFNDTTLGVSPAVTVSSQYRLSGSILTMRFPSPASSTGSVSFAESDVRIR